jgi:hypothetical protein
MKEPILAIVIGFIIGLVITFGIWTANKSLKQAQNVTPSPTVAVETTPTVDTTPGPSDTPKTPTSSLLVSTPEDESIFNSASAKIAGSAPAKSIVTIVGSQNEQILQADAQGQFSTEITLESGYNLITITAFDPQGASQSKTLTLTYTTAKI